MSPNEARLAYEPKTRRNVPRNNDKDGTIRRFLVRVKNLFLPVRKIIKPEMINTIRSTIILFNTVAGRKRWGRGSESTHRIGKI